MVATPKKQNHLILLPGGVTPSNLSNLLLLVVLFTENQI